VVPRSMGCSAVTGETEGGRPDDPVVGIVITSASLSPPRSFGGDKKLILYQRLHYLSPPVTTSYPTFYVGAHDTAEVTLPMNVGKKVVTGGDSGDSVALKWIFLSPP
jgi:hypothetical protein